MHEMAIAESVFEIAFAEAEKHASAKIRKIKLSIGEFSGVVRDALEFAFEVLKPGTAAENVEIEIEVVKMKTFCPKCGESECGLSDIRLKCDGCSGPLEVTAGREMQVDYIDLDDGV
ncbi:MAG TPA: hydrogenase maturation nickel metallochaperone HypA [Blastocatellia bacterium]|nr:hydrogenase maturation nickel metallochaperone HypA [Blastocatellia bacterium]